MSEEIRKENPQPEERKELSPEELEMVSGGFAKPVGTDEIEDKPILENLQDNKGADE